MPYTLTGDTTCVAEAALAAELAALPGFDVVLVEVDVAPIEGVYLTQLRASWSGLRWEQSLSVAPADCPAVATTIAQSVERGTRGWPPVRRARGGQQTSFGVGFRLPVDPLPAGGLGQVQLDHARGHGAVAPLASLRVALGTPVAVAAPDTNCFPAACADPRRAWTVGLQVGGGARFGADSRFALDLSLLAGPAMWWGRGFPDDRTAVAPALEVTATARWQGPVSPLAGVGVQPLVTRVTALRGRSATSPPVQLLVGVVFGG